MSLKALLFLAPVAAGGWYFAHKDAVADPAKGDAQAKAVATPRKSHAECNALEQRLLLANAPGDRNPVRTMATLVAVERELRAQGCDTMNGYGEGNAFRTPSNQMGDAPARRIHTSYEASNGSPSQDRRPTGMNFDPGRPMVDVSRGHDR